MNARIAIAYSPRLKQLVINTDGPIEQVRTWISDEQANGGYEGVIAVRLPRRMSYDRFRSFGKQLVRR